MCVKKESSNFSQSTIAKTDSNEVSPVHLIFFLRIFQLWVLVKKEMTQPKSVWNDYYDVPLSSLVNNPSEANGMSLYDFLSI